MNIALSNEPTWQPEDKLRDQSSEGILGQSADYILAG
jgi:hypothetical protein